jgi:uncharacterized membrane protein (UPF0127 family)
MSDRSHFRIQNLKKQALIADKCLVAEGFSQRLFGLIGKKTMEPGEGLLFPRCNDIHMWFMSVPIDVVFLRAEQSDSGRKVYRVVSVRETVRPWRLLPLRDGRATDTLELTAGTVRRCQVEAGDELCIG